MTQALEMPNQQTILDLRRFRWTLLEKHSPSCVCNHCVQEQRLVSGGWPIEREYRWFGIGIDLPPLRAKGSWYTLRWSWRESRYYLRICR